MNFRDYPPAARDVVLRPLREAIEKRRRDLASQNAGPSTTRDWAAGIAADIAVMTAAIALLEG